MKYLEYPGLSRLNAFLRHCDASGERIEGVVEAYSCKLAGGDKKLSKSLEHDVIDEIVSSPDQKFGVSPLGPLSEASSRKTLIYLILTLNHMYPDYDFSMLRAKHFSKEPSVAVARVSVENRLIAVVPAWSAEGGGGGTPSGSIGLYDEIWRAVDEAIGLSECDVYSYNADEDDDPFHEKGVLWSFNYFFYNRSLKRVLYFACKGVSGLVEDDNDSMSDDDARHDYEDDGLIDEMEC